MSERASSGPYGLAGARARAPRGRRSSALQGRWPMVRSTPKATLDLAAGPSSSCGPRAAGATAPAGEARRTGPLEERAPPSSAGGAARYDLRRKASPVGP